MIKNVHIYRYEIPIETALKVKQGLILSIQTDQGNTSFGEIAPLIGFSNESLSLAFDQMRSLLPILKNKDIHKALSWLFEQKNLMPSVSAALFGALYGNCQSDETMTFDVSGLLYGSYENILRDIPYILKQSFSHVKVKLGNLTPLQACEILYALKGRCSLRVDLNRSWPLDVVERFFTSFPLDFFDYIEEPFLTYSHATSLSHPIAFDETARENEIDFLKNYFQLKAIVLKPMLLGASQKTSQLFDLCKAKPLTLSLSSSFETGVGLYQIALFAKYYECKNPLGVDTYRFIPQDVLIKRHFMTNGKMTFAKPIIDMRYLTEVL